MLVTGGCVHGRAAGTFPVGGCGRTARRHADAAAVFQPRPSAGFGGLRDTLGGAQASEDYRVCTRQRGVLPAGDAGAFGRNVLFRDAASTAGNAASFGRRGGRRVFRHAVAVSAGAPANPSSGREHALYAPAIGVHGDCTADYSAGDAKTRQVPCVFPQFCISADDGGAADAAVSGAGEADGRGGARGVSGCLSAGGRRHAEPVRPRRRVFGGN